ncbi:hypothetical protein OG485_14865 [Streptomyces sp. NBC_00328]|nr:hypothetical protein [Streptomyces sp. NBC_00328]
MGHNDALRAARLRAGWRTIGQAAVEVTEHGQRLLDDNQFTVSARTWRRWEGERPGWPAEETAIVLHDALGRWPEDLGFTTPPGWIRPEHHEEADVKRRAFVSVTAAALIVGPIAPQHVDPALITYFQQQLEGHYRADMFLGPHDLIGTVSAQYQLIDKLVRSAKGETRRGLLRVGAAYAALVGWLYQDTRKPRPQGTKRGRWLSCPCSPRHQNGSGNVTSPWSPVHTIGLPPWFRRVGSRRLPVFPHRQCAVSRVPHKLCAVMRFGASDLVFRLPLIPDAHHGQPVWWLTCRT